MGIVVAHIWAVQAMQKAHPVEARAPLSNKHARCLCESTIFTKMGGGDCVTVRAVGNDTVGALIEVPFRSGQGP